MDLNDDVEPGGIAGHHRHLRLISGGALDQPVQALVRPVEVPVIVLREAAAASGDGDDVAHGLRTGFASLRQLLDEGHLAVERVQEGLTLRPSGLPTAGSLLRQPDTLRAVRVEGLAPGSAHRHHRGQAQLPAHLRPAHTVGQAQVNLLGVLALDAGHIRHHLVVVGRGVIPVAVPGFNRLLPGVLPNQVPGQRGIVHRHPGFLLRIVVGRPHLTLLREVDGPPHRCELIAGGLLLEVRMLAGQPAISGPGGPVRFIVLLAAELVEGTVEPSVDQVVPDGLPEGRAQLVHLPGTLQGAGHWVVDARQQLLVDVGLALGGLFELDADVFEGGRNRLRLPDIAHVHANSGVVMNRLQGFRLLGQRPLLDHVQSVQVNPDAPAAQLRQDGQQAGLQVIHAPQVLLINLPLLTAQDVQRQAGVLLRVWPNEPGGQLPHVLLRVNLVVHCGFLEQLLILAVEAPTGGNRLHAVAVIQLANQRVRNLDVPEEAGGLVLNSVPGQVVQVIREVGPHDVALEHGGLIAEVAQHLVHGEVVPTFVSHRQVEPRPVLNREAHPGDVAVRAASRSGSEFAQVRVPGFAVHGDALGVRPRGQRAQLRRLPVALGGHEQRLLHQRTSSIISRSSSRARVSSGSASQKVRMRTNSASLVVSPFDSTKSSKLRTIGAVRGGR